MGNLISRSALVKILVEWPERLGKIDPKAEILFAERLGCLGALAAIRHEVDMMPAVDAVPVVHAKWNDHNCTNCFAMCVTARTPQGFIYNIETPYCPNCGARMDGDADA